MGLKSVFMKRYVRYVSHRLEKWRSRQIEDQQHILKGLLKKGGNTQFGKDHHFESIKTYDEFKKSIPIRDYEALRPYLDRVVAGEENICWPGKPLYFAKTSGTTSGTKYIPISKESMSNHIHAAHDALMNYVHLAGLSSIFDGKMIFLSGSPVLEKKNGILTGRLSGIVNHHIPAWLHKNQLPSHETNCIDDWEQKVDTIVEETWQKNMTLISGIPPWIQMYYERLMKKSGKKIGDLFPAYQLFIYGGVNFSPYREKLLEMQGRYVHTLATYPASEGFIAFQDQLNDNSLLLNTHDGIFYEFVKADEIFDENPTRYSLEEIEKGIHYAIILSTNAGLWAYNIGDTVKFVSTQPYRLHVTGRTKHFISAFGEHVIAEEVESALDEVASHHNAQIIEFTVAAQVAPQEGLPYHEWYIEFENAPFDLDSFAGELNKAMMMKNTYYHDLIDGAVLRPLVLRCLHKDSFRNYMKSIGKLGGQNKVPRLANNRDIADKLNGFILKR